MKIEPYYNLQDKHILRGFTDISTTKEELLLAFHQSVDLSTLIVCRQEQNHFVAHRIFQSADLTDLVEQFSNNFHWSRQVKLYVGPGEYQWLYPHGTTSLQLIEVLLEKRGWLVNTVKCQQRSLKDQLKIWEVLLNNNHPHMPQLLIAGDFCHALQKALLDQCGVKKNDVKVKEKRARINGGTDGIRNLQLTDTLDIIICERFSYLAEEVEEKSIINELQQAISFLEKRSRAATEIKRPQLLAFVSVLSLREVTAVLKMALNGEFVKWHREMESLHGPKYFP